MKQNKNAEAENILGWTNASTTNMLELEINNCTHWLMLIFFFLSSSRVKIWAPSSGHRTTPSLWKDTDALRYFNFEHFHHPVILPCHKHIATDKMTVILSEISQFISENKTPGRCFTHSNFHEWTCCMHWRSHTVTDFLKVFHSSMLSPDRSDLCQTKTEHVSWWTQQIVASS